MDGGDEVTTLRYLGTSVHRPVRGYARNTAKGPEGARLHLVTEGGSLRYVPVTRAELVKLIQDAAGALATLDREEGKTP